MKASRFGIMLVLAMFVLALAVASVFTDEATAAKRATSTPRPTKTLTPIPTATLVPSPTAKPGGGEVDYGSLYGDLYVILRDINGVPLLDSYGCVQPIAADGTILTLYTNPAEDILCEVTEELALLVQNVDFGRLNLGRAPDSVLAHAFDEAVNLMNSAIAMDVDPAGRLMLLIDDEWKTIDAPAENLALYIKMMKDGHWITTDTSPITRGQGGGGGQGGGPPEGDGPSTEPRPVLSDAAIALLASIGYGHLGDTNHAILESDELLLAASLLAAAADKTGAMTLDKVIYINSIYGINQMGTLPGEASGVNYYDFRGFGYSRPDLYGQQRGSNECSNGFVWVLRPEGESGMFWATDCMNILSEVHHLSGQESANVRGFVQAADDALQVIEYIHNYRVPEILP